METKPERAAVSTLASVSSLTTSILSPYCSLISSRIGATLRHGPHHVAQKSTSTGLSLMRTSSAKVASVVFFSAMEIPSRGWRGGGGAGSCVRASGSTLGVGADRDARVGDLARVRLVDDGGLGSGLGG